MEIYNKILKYPQLQLENKPQEEILKSIKEKRNIEYFGVYELLVHEKLKE